MEQTYTLNCAGCGQPFESNEGFPDPQYCCLCSATFKAGYEKGFNDCIKSSLENDFEGGKREGIREVVELLEEWDRCETNPEAFRAKYPDFEEYCVAGIVGRNAIFTYIKSGV